jgi:hypothetical protein
MMTVCAGKLTPHASVAVHTNKRSPPSSKARSVIDLQYTAYSTSTSSGVKTILEVQDHMLFILQLPIVRDLSRWMFVSKCAAAVHTL